MSFSFYSFAFRVCNCFFRLYFNFVVNGACNIDNLRDGGILISNHKSYLDPVVLGIFFRKKRLYFMAKRELFYVPILKTIIRKLGAFPVDRKKKSFNVIEKAADMVKDKKLVAMFPQGHRCNILDLSPKTGFIRIALLSKSLVFPCCVRYSGFWPRSKVYVSFAKSIDIFEYIKNEGINPNNINYKDIKYLTFKIWQEVLNLYNKKGAL